MKRLLMLLALMLACAGLAGGPALAPAKERLVGLFYFLWLGEHGRNPPRDVTKILAKDPKAGYKPNDPVWGPVGFYHHWGEPLYGYYYSDDEWVVRHHMKLLIQANIDFLFFDTTNAIIYEKNAKLVMRVLQEYHDAGWKIPRVMFYTNTRSGATAQQILDKIYKPKFASDTWFKLDGKPVIVAIEKECSPEVKQFFTIVKSQWPNEPDKKGGWPWMDFTRPQRLFPGERVAKSVMNVSIAQHPQIHFGDSAMYGEKANRGRAFHHGVNDPAPGAWKKGYNAAEQWDRVDAVDPDIVLVTGWNEWIAGRWPGSPGRPISFVDCANMEYSRDIEMMRGGYGDAYYLQLVDRVKKYKRLKDDTALNPRGKLKRYRCFADAGFVRHAAGYGTVYTNATARNVPRWIAIGHTADDVRFEVETYKPITRAKTGDWMQILVNGTSVNARGRVTVQGTRFVLTVPRRKLGLPVKGPFTLNVKFVDSTVACKDPLDWYDHGVVAPLGRLPFVYRGE